MTQKTRTEKDSLGEFQVPSEVYYGAETARAIENYPISGLRFHPVFVWATAAIKIAAAKANMKRGALDKKIGDAIVKASEEVMAGKLAKEFPVDVFQSGAGVSQHMNTNEVITNRALEILGHEKGDYKKVHSHDHVNMGQSTNDVIPSALRVATTKLLSEFYPAAQKLVKSLEKKSKEFTDVVKSGRTHMQDAAPITLGQEFEGYAGNVQNCIDRVKHVSDYLLDLGIGGSAVGTGLNTTVQYRNDLVANLGEITGFKFRSAKNLFEKMQSASDFSAVSGELKTLALVLIQICNDLRLLSSGPKTGFNEIVLPARQPGSSIMPGKINPVMPEMTTIVCFQVIGNDTAISMATQAGQLELNVMIPTVIHNLLQTIEILKNTCSALATMCIDGITANEDVCIKFSEESYGIAAALNPYIGYSKAAEVVKESVKTGKTMRKIILEKKLLSKEELDKILSPKELTTPKQK